ncbi:phage infection protein [Listeria floridensis FSL S10-1187]|uniref:Phage infection protein n=1 Tax=Listeria floridensis FSL S10-1187 TaxID=1265817 RepID=A0ABN0RCZ9_9LIST|nr:phage infection protein [Listeria floridensis FSL S10-1187]
MDWRRVFKAPLALLLVVALVILPSLYAWFNIEALWDPYSNTKGIKVAVSIDDQGANVTVPGKNEHVNIGSELKKKLAENKKLGWTFVSNEEAQKGVKSGKYYAAIHLPKDFSKDMVSVVTNDAKKPQIDYSVNEKINAIAPKMTDSGASTIVNQISGEFVGTVSKAVLTEFNKAGINLENELPTLRKVKTKIFAVQEAIPEINKMGEAAQELEKKMPAFRKKASQVEAFSDRIPEINQAASELLKVEAAIPKLDELGNEILILQTKIPEIKKVATGVKEVQQNFGTVKKTLNDALKESSQALGILNAAEDALPEVKKIAADGSKYADQVSQFADQVDASFDTVAPAIKTNLTLAKQIADNVQALTNDLLNGNLSPDEAVQVLTDIENGLTELDGLLNKQINLLSDLNDTLPNHPLSDLITELKGFSSLIVEQKETAAQLKKDFAAGKEPQQELLERLNADSAKISSRLSGVLNRYDSKIVPAIQSGLAEIKADSTKSGNLLKTAQSKLPEIGDILSNSKQTLQTATSYLKAFMARLPEIEQGLNEAAEAIDTKLAEVITGINQAAAFYKNDFPAIKAKLHQAGNFIRNDLPGLETELRNASKLIAEKMPEFEKAVTTAADLSRNELPAFEKAINQATNKITDFDKQYNLKDIIAFLRNDADKDSAFIANPIQLKQTEYYKIPNYGSASSPFYTALCLWVGALLVISLLRVDVDVPGGLFTHIHRYFGRLLTFLSIGLMQALTVTLGNIFLLDVYIKEPVWHVLFSLFISLVFMTIVYTLVSLFNNVGKGIAIIMLVLQISGAGGNFPIQVSPPFFQAIYPFLPFTYAVNLIRESVGGLYLPSVYLDLGVLLGFAVVFILIGTLLKKPLDKIVPKLSAKAKKSKLIH